MRRHAIVLLGTLGLAACGGGADFEPSASPPAEGAAGTSVTTSAASPSAEHESKLAPRRLVDETGVLRTTAPVDPSTLPPRPVVTAPAPAPLPLPSRMMLDEQGWITPVRDQGGRGSCQTFATVGAIESEYLRQYGTSLDLSEEYLVNMYDETGSPNWTGGGVYDKLMEASYYALPPETSFPYIPNEMTVVNAALQAFGLTWGTTAGNAVWGSLNKGSPTFNVLNSDIANYNSYVYPPQAAHANAVYGPASGAISSVALSSTDPSSLEAVLASGHPIAFITGLNMWSQQPSGVFDTNGQSPAWDHAVLLVGYDHTKQIFRIKNQWGAGWNGNGFADLTYNLLLNDITDATYVTAIRNPQQTANAGGGGLRGFWSAVVNGVKGVVVIHHAFQSTGAVAVMTDDAGYFYGSDGSVLALEWVAGGSNNATFTVKNATSGAKTIYLASGANGWSYAAMSPSGDAVERGTWCRSVPTAGSKLLPTSYVDALNDPSVFPSGSCVASAGPAVSHQPSVFVRSSGEADVVAQGPQNSLVYKWAMPGGAWYTTTIAGANTTFSAPAIYVRSTGEADVVAEGPNNSLMYYWAMPGGAWNSAMIAGAWTTYSAPSIFVRSTGEADVVAEGPQNSLSYRWAMPGGWWNSATIAGAGTTFSAPSIFVRSTGEADVVTQGPNHSLSYFWAMPGTGWWSATIAGTNTTYSQPSIFVRSTGEADVVAEGLSNTLMYYWAMPGTGWWSATVASCATTYSAPQVFVRSTGEADIVAEGPNGSLFYYYAMPGTAWTTTQIGANGSTMSAPSIFVRPLTGEADVVAENLSSSTTYYHATPGSPWYSSGI